MAYITDGIFIYRAHPRERPQKKEFIVFLIFIINEIHKYEI